MTTLLLVVIYLTFISLGLPDALLGSSWSAIRADFCLGLSMASPIYMTISFCTIVSSLACDKLVKRFKTQHITLVSVLLTALALLGYSVSGGYIWLIILAIPLGLGAGAVDTCLNNYVAVHFKPHHMSWLHCFWGVGALLGPLIMSAALRKDNNWHLGYRYVGIIQCALVLILFLALPLWKHAHVNEVFSETETYVETVPLKKDPGIYLAILIFLLYCGVEQGLSMWSTSYFIEARGMDSVTAARWCSLFFVGLTVGRFATGVLTMLLSYVRLIRYGIWLILIGILPFFLPVSKGFLLFGLVLIGVGCAPVFPGTIHETPVRFGVSRSQKVIGIQMASAYTGNVLLPPLIGGVADITKGIQILPIFILVFAIGLLLCTELLNRLTAKRGLIQENE